MLSFKNIVISGNTHTSYNITSSSNGPTTCTYFINPSDGEPKHYDLENRGPNLRNYKKGQCANPVSVFAGFSRQRIIDPNCIVSFFDTFGRFTPFDCGNLDGDTILKASRRLLCLLEIMANHDLISQEKTPAEMLLGQYSRCIELLAYGKYFDSRTDLYLGVYSQDNNTGEIIINSPFVSDFMQFLCGNYLDEEYAYTDSSFELTQKRLKIISDELQKYPFLDETEKDLYLQERPYLPRSYEQELFRQIEKLSSFAWFYDNSGQIVAQIANRSISKSEQEALQMLSKYVIERELNHYVQPLQFRYSYDTTDNKELATLEISCVHQLIYFSLMGLPGKAIYVNCSRERCTNKTVKLYGDTIIPCCCTSCRTAAASKRSRDIPKYVEKIKQNLIKIEDVPSAIREQVLKKLD